MTGLPAGCPAGCERSELGGFITGWPTGCTTGCPAIVGATLSAGFLNSRPGGPSQGGVSPRVGSSVVLGGTLGCSITALGFGVGWVGVSIPCCLPSG
jgi:hypothetical protein